MKIGIIREGKIPADSRVPLTPTQCVKIQEKYPEVSFVIEPSPNRCISDEEYLAAGLLVSADLSACEVMMGVKEVPINQLIPNKTYFFFSHTIKEQPYNRKLLQAILQKNIRLVDYEVLTNTQQQRVIAFGRFAGIAGAHNGLMTYGTRTGSYSLKQMVKFKDFEEAKAYYKTIKFPSMKIVLTGGGRVAKGAAEVLEHAGIQEVSPHDFLSQDYNTAVYTRLDSKDYVAHQHNTPFVRSDFFANPQNYNSIFAPYSKVADLMVNGIYWNNQAPPFFSAEEMAKDNFNIKVIADITCDIAPTASIPSTLFASTITNPVFGYDPKTQKAVEPYQEHTIDMMTIDNLPNEMPRDASLAFGEQFIQNVLDELLNKKDTGMLERATITHNGQLGSHFQYLQNYVAGL